MRSSYWTSSALAEVALSAIWNESFPSQRYDSISWSVALSLEDQEPASLAAWTVSIVSGTDPLFEGSHIDVQMDRFALCVYANGMRIAKINPDGSVHYVLSDHQGSTRTILDANRVEQYSVESEPFGKPYSTSGPKPDPHKYAMEKHDDPTGLVYLRARQYDPEIGRFVSADPVLGSLSRPQTLNRYAYVANNPVNRVDPSGMYDCWPGAGDRSYQTCLTWNSWHDTVANVNLGPRDFWTGMDLLMMGVGFIPVLGDIVSTVYFLGRDVQECLTSGCNWVNIGLDAAGILPLVPALGGAARLARAASQADEFLDPRTIRFGQSSIRQVFQAPRTDTIWDLAVGLRIGTIDPSDIPPIRVHRATGITLDNRRLVAFQLAGVPVPVKYVDDIPQWMVRGSGTSIRIRGAGMWDPFRGLY